MLKLMGKKIFTILRSNFLFIKTYVKRVKNNLYSLHSNNTIKEEPFPGTKRVIFERNLKSVSFYPESDHLVTRIQIQVGLKGSL